MALFVDVASDSDEANPFSFTKFLEKPTKLPPEPEPESTSDFSSDDERESPTEENGKDGKNPFSFKCFIKKEKRKAVYYSSREHLDSSGMEEEDLTEEMGNQNGTAPSSGAATSEVSNSNNTTNTTTASNGTSSSNNGRTNQRRATSPGMPNHARRKGGRSVQSTAGGTPAPPPPVKPANIQQQPPPPPCPQPHPHQQQQQAVIAEKQEKGNDFVDFIYDYATKGEGEEDESNGHSGEDLANKKNKAYDAVVAGDLAGHREQVDKKQARGERARAHTHGHAARKHKSPASKPNTKSTLVVDYIDASHNPQTYSPGGLTVPDLNVGNDDNQFDEFSRPKAVTESKPHRERARAHSHGHRKKGSSDVKNNKQKGMSSSSDSSEREAITNLLAVPPKPAKPTENGQRSKLSSSTNELDNSGREGNKSRENLADISMSEKRPATPPGSSSPPPGDGQNGGDASTDLARLRQENSRLRKDLADTRKSSDKDSKKIESMEAEIKKLKLREAEDAKTLETMVQHVEANLKRTTERAVTAETTITKLKAEIKQLKGEPKNAEKRKIEENKELKDIKEKANAASLKLATAAKEAEANIKQLMGGVDALKLLAETLGCIDRISEDPGDKPKSFGTAL